MLRAEFNLKIMSSELTVALVAENAKNSIRILGATYGSQYLTPGLTGLADSMGRIQVMNVQTPDEATVALQDHFNAISALTDADISNLKSLADGVAFTNCESMLKILLAKGARARFN